MKLLLALALVSVMGASSIYDFKETSLEGKTIDFSKYKGKTLLIVNVASKCGNTPQYADLQKLHDTMGSKVVILGFPANNFRGQEPGSNAEIAEFCKANYGVTFQMFEKISVLGADTDPLYVWLKEKTGKEPDWNFAKYLVKPDGTVKFFNAKTKPMDQTILDEII
ncbi:MAG TPA: glutathione peroxidase [Cyclobacteriaceae bacterium]|jgi:glutathione peroxidase|nr:glutathione peroxidase [Cyclobacteriaceae bacterium]